MSDGQVIAVAEGFVGEDEPTWFGGTMKAWKWGERRGEKIFYDKEMPKRADYAIRAMAQTSAISRACRSALDRKSVVSGKSVSVRVDLGGRSIIKKKLHRILNDIPHKLTIKKTISNKRY